MSGGNGICPGCALTIGTPGADHDPCLGMLPGISFACCGHKSDTKIAYLSFGERGMHSIRFDPRDGVHKPGDLTYTVFSRPAGVQFSIWVTEEAFWAAVVRIQAGSVPEDLFQGLLVSTNNLEQYEDLITSGGSMHGRGTCPDCRWFEVPEGCNVPRDSPACKLNRNVAEEL